MSFRSSSHRYVQWVFQRSQEVGHLVWHGLRSPRQFQDLLVRQAQTAGNRTALQVLQTQKEWNDLRYYGLAEYLRQKVVTTTGSIAGLWPSSLLSNGTTTNSDTNSVTPTTGTTVSASASANSSIPAAAKVAFMVTGRMKEQLSELGYTPDQIKQFKPVEASLLLEHGVAPAEHENDLPGLVQAYEAQQAKEAEEAHKKQQQTSAALQAAAQKTSFEIPVATQSAQGATTATPATDTGTSWSPPSSSLVQQLFGSIASANVRGQPTSIASRTHAPSQPKVWYEVVEEYNDGKTESEVVALHSTQEEAQVDADLRLELITKRAEREHKHVATSYSVHETTR